MIDPKVREAHEVRKQYKAWQKWLDAPCNTPEPPRPNVSAFYIANRILAEFAAEILERNP